MNTFLLRPAARRLLCTALLLLAGALAAAEGDLALPAPRGNEAAITRILSARHETAAFSSAGLSAQAVADLLWASSGVNRPIDGYRTTNYSYKSRDNEIYLLCAEGVFVYDQVAHQLTRRSTTDLRPTLGAPASTAPATIALATYAGDVDFFGAIHTAFIAENIALACADRGLGAHLSSTFPAGLPAALELTSGRTLLLLQTIGYPEGASSTEPPWTVTAGALVPAAVNDAPALRILKRRRSNGNLAATPFPLQTLAELGWAGMGINNYTPGERTSPLVTGVHDIDIYAAMAGGVYRYSPGVGAAHYFEKVSSEEIRDDLSYPSVPVILIYVADYAKLSGTDAQKRRMACLHAGVVSQNVAAYAASEGLGEKVRSSVSVPTSALKLITDQHLLFTQTLGYPSSAPGPATVTFAAGTGGSVTNGSVTPAPSQSIAFGATGAAVTAVPSSGYTFAYWSGLPGGRVRTATLALPNVTCPMNVAAVFTPDPATYADWRAVSFFGADLADAISGPGADPDSAGVTNLQRYAFALAARGRVVPPTTIGSVEDGGNKYLTITFGRRATGTGLSYVVESSPDLADWSAVRTYYPDASTPVVAQDAVAMDAAGLARRFLRVRVVATP